MIIIIINLFAIFVESASCFHFFSFMITSSYSRANDPNPIPFTPLINFVRKYESSLP